MSHAIPSSSGWAATFTLNRLRAPVDADTDALAEALDVPDAGLVCGERSSDARIAAITRAFAAPGVGLEPTTYGLTIPAARFAPPSRSMPGCASPQVIGRYVSAPRRCKVLMYARVR